MGKTTKKAKTVKKAITAKNANPKKDVIEAVRIPLKKAAVSPSEKAAALYEGEEYKKALERLKNLRKEGEWKILKIKDENINIKINKQLTKEGRKKLLEMNKGEMATAKGVALQNQSESKEIIERIANKSKAEFAPIFEEAKAYKKELICKAITAKKEGLLKAKEEYQKDLEVVNHKFLKTGDKKTQKIDAQAARISYRSKINAIQSEYTDTINKAKEEKYATYQASYEYLSRLRLNKHTTAESVQYGYETYTRNFNLINWLTKNALIIIVLLFFFVLFIISTAQGNSILQPTSLLTALTQISPKVFFALGVAGLILLGGTDLSIGRLTGVGTCFALMCLSPVQHELSWFPFLNGSPAFVRVMFAILIPVIICTAFTSIAGFFTAKFKMHPFISTLAIQLIVYGIFQAFFSAVPSFNIADETGGGNIREMLMGSKAWLLIIYAAIAIAIVWFIWNKTKFGKHLYAVGGNQEAAAVSGINPFVITMLAFVMAGILYGLGGFMSALKDGPNNFNYGAGTETDAIAACVIGGVSFSGGVGSIGGVVGGAVILGFLTFCFKSIGLDNNIQFIIKGVIILTAVTLDCVKYIRKK